MNETDDEQINVERMSADEFKSMLILKGWKMKDLATRWQLNPVRITQLCKDTKRAIHYDDALRALPIRIKPNKN